ncbi:MAG: hypothetical protein ABL958_00880 [Bdellovibrionia bacterium]
MVRLLYVISLMALLPALSWAQTPLNEQGIDTFQGKGITYDVPRLPLKEDGTIDEKLVEAVNAMPAAQQESFRENRKSTLQKYVKALIKVDLLRFFDGETARAELDYLESPAGAFVPQNPETKKSDRAVLASIPQVSTSPEIADPEAPGRVRRAHLAVKWLSEKVLTMVNNQIWHGLELYSRGVATGFTFGVNLVADFNVGRFGFWRSLGIGVNYFKDKETGRRHVQIFWQTENKIPDTVAISAELGFSPQFMRYKANPETFQRERILVGKSMLTPGSLLSRVDQGSMGLGMQVLGVNVVTLALGAATVYLTAHGMPVAALVSSGIWMTFSAINFANFARFESRRHFLKGWIFGKRGLTCSRLIF